MEFSITVVFSKIDKIVLLQEYSYFKICNKIF